MGLMIDSQNPDKYKWPGLTAKTIRTGLAEYGAKYGNMKGDWNVSVFGLNFAYRE